MSEKRVTRQYEMEFKLDAVQLVEEQGYSVPEAAQRLGIPKSKLTNWPKQYREGRLAPGPRRAQPTAEEAERRTASVTEALGFTPNCVSAARFAPCGE
jgi:transposase